MKLKKQPKSLPVNFRPKVKLTHGQSIKQSHNYQSADCSYSAELLVEDTPESIKQGIKRLEVIVEDALSLKVTQQRKFLEQITGHSTYEDANKAGARRSRF